MKIRRELWLDYLRGFACVLVTLGHMFMGLQDAKICTNSFVSWGIDLIYHFHVYIFFFCSGYLMQKSFLKSIENPDSTEHSRFYGGGSSCGICATFNSKFLIKKLFRCLDFIIMYIVFTGITFIVKTLVSNGVNSPIEHTFIQTLLEYPINQMWYLYAIVIITLCTPMIRSKFSMMLLLIISILLKLVIGLQICEGLTMVLPIRYLCSNQIWYVLGSVWAYKNFIPKKWCIFPGVLIFITVSTWAYLENIHNYYLDSLLTLIGISVTAIFFFIYRSNKSNISVLWKLIAKYMLQIYLLHTICAAGIRIILVKIGITNIFAHIILGILFSFGVPILVGIVTDKSQILNIFFYPSKIIKKMFLKRS